MFRPWFRQPAQTVLSPESTPADRVRRAAALHAKGIASMVGAREALVPLYANYDCESDAVIEQQALLSRIEEVLERYRADRDVYKYFYGHPYQGLALAGVFGDRVCDYRFDDYELRKFISPTDRVLDIGCNCGFMAILASYRTGCISHGIDINSYMIEIGRLVAAHLRIQELVSLEAGRLEHHSPERTYNVVLSFATHWTDDKNYRVILNEHMARMASFLLPGGILVFETHCNDVGQPEFYAALEESKAQFSFDGLYKRTDSGTRELYIMRKR